MPIELLCDGWLAEIDPRGAELRRFYDISGEDDILWRGDVAVWSGSAPILFPIVGRLKHGRYVHNGQTYELPKHGFARTSEFRVGRREPDALQLVLTSSPATLEAYPFRFELDVIFRLNTGEISVEYVIRNHGDGEMLFTLGSHPGIALPPAQGPYAIEFEQPETLDVYRLEKDLLQTAGSPYLRDERRIPITPELFNRDALIFKSIRSRRVSVCNASGSRKVTVATGGAPHLGLWAKPGADYVCIEPWFGYDDDAAGGGELAGKPGMLHLAPGESFGTGYAISKA